MKGAVDESGGPDYPERSCDGGSRANRPDGLD